MGFSWFRAGWLGTSCYLFPSREHLLKKNGLPETLFILDSIVAKSNSDVFRLARSYRDSSLSDF